MKRLVPENEFYNRQKSDYSEEERFFSRFAFGDDENYHQYGVVYNSKPMYVRDYPKEGMFQLGFDISPTGRYENMSETERDSKCPIVAWGYSSYLFRALYTSQDKNDSSFSYGNELCVIINTDHNSDFMISNEKNVQEKYYNIFWNDFLIDRRGIRYIRYSERKNELDFCKIHYKEEKALWKKTLPILKTHLKTKLNTNASILLFEDLGILERSYLKYIRNRRRELKYWYIYNIKNWLKVHCFQLLSIILKTTKELAK